MDQKLLTLEELANHLQMKKSWLYSRTRQKGPNTLPVVRCGKYCRFRLVDVLEWLKRQQVEKD